MTALLVIDTATRATVVGVAAGGRVVERRHDPPGDERPGHVSEVLTLAEAALAAAALGYRDIERIGVGVGPGSFTGLRIGITTARALAHATGALLAPVSTLGALAVGAGALDPGTDGAVLAVLDARRGEAFVTRWEGGTAATPPRAVDPAQLITEATGASLAVGDGAVLFRAQLESAGVTVPEDGSTLHRVGATGLARLAATAPVIARDALVPDYVRRPDAVPRVAR